MLQLFCRYLLCNAVVEDENEYLNVLVAVNELKEMKLYNSLWLCLIETCKEASENDHDTITHCLFV